MTKTKILAALAVGLLAMPLASYSAPVTELISFDDATNGWSWYSTADRNFLFDPTNMQSSSLCANGIPSGNGSCVIDGSGQNGLLPTMTRPTNQTVDQGGAGGPNGSPTYVGGGGPGANQLFTLDSFYFLLTGQGQAQSNTLTVEGTFADNTTLSCTFTIGIAGSSCAGVGITYYDPPNAGQSTGTDLLAFNEGYIASFGSLFTDVTQIQWSALDSGQTRLDCVVATFDGTTTSPASDFGGLCGLPASSSSGGTPGSAAPEPGTATLALLGLGLIGAGLESRRRKATR